MGRVQEEFQEEGEEVLWSILKYHWCYSSYLLRDQPDVCSLPYLLLFSSFLRTPSECMLQYPTSELVYGHYLYLRLHPV